MSGRPEPRLRGVVHQYAFFATIVVGLVLIVAVHGRRERLALAIYVAAAAAMLGASALYHRAPWRSASVRMRARRVDHSMIFVFIAATYTAFALLAFTGLVRVFVLAFAWAGALLGILLQVLGAHAPRWSSALVYLAVGWAGVLALPQVFSGHGPAPVLLIVAGGALYSLGALAYALAWPDPFPTTFGYHEIFHVLVVGAVTAQLGALLLLVL